jgi:type VI protein secretion system component VasF
MSGPERSGSPGGAADVEGLLRRALAPVDPPEDLSARVRGTLQSIRETAAEELEGWELAAMRDPRNWVRPAVAVVGGAAAGAGLLLLGLQQRRRVRSRTLLERAEQTASDVAASARKFFEPR